MRHAPSRCNVLVGAWDFNIPTPATSHRGRLFERLRLLIRAFRSHSGCSPRIVANTARSRNREFLCAPTQRAYGSLTDRPQSRQQRENRAQTFHAMSSRVHADAHPDTRASWSPCVKSAGASGLRENSHRSNSRCPHIRKTGRRQPYLRTEGASNHDYYRRNSRKY